MTFRKYNKEMYISLNEEPSSYRSIDEGDFIELQLLAQARLNDINWEINNVRALNRYQKGATYN